MVEYSVTKNHSFLKSNKTKFGKCFCWESSRLGKLSGVVCREEEEAWVKFAEEQGGGFLSYGKHDYWAKLFEVGYHLCCWTILSRRCSKPSLVWHTKTDNTVGVTKPSQYCKTTPHVQRRPENSHRTNLRAPSPRCALVLTLIMHRQGPWLHIFWNWPPWRKTIKSIKITTKIKFQ